MPLHVSRAAHKRATSQDPSASRPVKRTKRKHDKTNQTTVAGDLHVEESSDSDDEMPALEPLCTMCNSAGAVTCTRCHSGRYCSKRCQEGDWLSHKLLCKSFSKLRKPAPGTVRAILFPTDTLRPQWVELPPWELGKSRVHEKIAERLQSNPLELAHSAIRRNDVLDRDVKRNDMGLRRTIRIARPISCAEKHGESGAVNRSVVSATCGQSSTIWRGPIIAFGAWQTELWESVSSFDLDMEDYRSVLDHFLYHQSYLEPPRLRFGSTWSHTAYRVEGVRINCIGDQVFRGLPAFEPVSIPRRHKMFDIYHGMESCASHISESVGMPVRAWKLQMDPDIVSTGAMKNYLSNASASALFFGSLDDLTDAGSRVWDRPSKTFEGEVGSVVIARSSGRPLSTYHAEMLCFFARYHMRAWFLTKDPSSPQRDSEGIWDCALKSYIPPEYERRLPAEPQGFFDQLDNSALVEFFEWYRGKKLEEDEYASTSPWIDVVCNDREPVLMVVEYPRVDVREEDNACAFQLVGPRFRNLHSPACFATLALQDGRRTNKRKSFAHLLFACFGDDKPGSCLIPTNGSSKAPMEYKRLIPHLRATKHWEIDFHEQSNPKVNRIAMSDSLVLCCLECVGHDKIVPPLLCKSLRDFGHSEGRMHRSVLFLVDKETPQWCWVPAHSNEEETEVVTADQHPDTIRSTVRSFQQKVLIPHKIGFLDQNPFGGTKKGSIGLFVLWPEDQKTAEPFNECLGAVVQVKNSLIRGAILVTITFPKRKMAGYNPRDYDLDLKDFAIVAGFLKGLLSFVVAMG